MSNLIKGNRVQSESGLKIIEPKVNLIENSLYQKLIGPEGHRAQCECLVVIYYFLTLYFSAK